MITSFSRSAPVKNILLATDFGVQSDRAEARAAERALALGATLHIVTISENAQCEIRTPDNVIAARFRKIYGSGLKIDIFSTSGKAWPAILNEARARNCEFVVLGPPHPSGFEEALLGSTAERVIHSLDVAVLIVRRRCYGPYVDVGMATDFSECSRHALVAASRLLPEAVFTVTHAYRVPFTGFIDEESNAPAFKLDAEDGLTRFMASLAREPSLRGRLKQVLSYGSPSEILGELADKHGIDLVVAGSHGSGGAFDKLLGGTADQLVRRLSCDVMVVRTPPS